MRRVEPYRGDGGNATSLAGHGQGRAESALCEGSRGADGGLAGATEDGGAHHVGIVLRDDVEEMQEAIACMSVGMMIAGDFLGSSMRSVLKSHVMPTMREDLGQMSWEICISRVVLYATD